MRKKILVTESILVKHVLKEVNKNTVIKNNPQVFLPFVNLLSNKNPVPFLHLASHQINYQQLSNITKQGNILIFKSGSITQTLLAQYNDDTILGNCSLLCFIKSFCYGNQRLNGGCHCSYIKPVTILGKVCLSATLNYLDVIGLSNALIWGNHSQ